MLPSGHTLYARRMYRGRVEVEAGGSGTGWMAREDLLCGVRPLKTEKGLERKFFIRTALYAADEAPNTVPAYEYPNKSECQGGCKELSRFDLYFVFADAGERLLLARDFQLGQRSELTGWVDRKSGW